MSGSSSPSEKGSSRESSDEYRILAEEGVNRGAAAATLSYMGDVRALGLLDKWREVTCPDGSKARVLKDPTDAFELYAKEWTTKFDVVLNTLNQLNVSAGAEVKSKIVKLFDNLNYVNAALQEMYKNSYLTFASTPCSESAQQEKRRMDRIIAAVGLSLVSIKLILDNSEGSNLDRINDEIIKLIDRVVTMLDKCADTKV
jgi:hypothetical protein